MGFGSSGPPGGSGFGPMLPPPTVGAPPRAGGGGFDFGLNPETIMLGLTALGSGLDYYNQRQAANRQNRRSDQLFGAAQGMMQGQPGTFEAILAQMLGGGGAGLNNQAMNVGQDAYMQFLRSNPAGSRDTQLDRTLNQLAGGQAFDTSSLFGALQGQDALALERSVAGLRGATGSLGRRFGTGLAGAEADLRRGTLADQATRNAGIAMQAFQANQANRLAATGQLAGLEGQRAGSFLQAAGGLGGLGATQISQLLQALGLGGQLQGQRAGINAQLLGIAGGIPTAAPPSLTQPIVDIASLYYLFNQGRR